MIVIADYCCLPAVLMVVAMGGPAWYGGGGVVCPSAAYSGLGKFKGFEALRSHYRLSPSPPPPSLPHQSRHT